MTVRAFDNTMLETYRQCPRRYYWRMVRHLSTGTSAPLVFGSAIHKGLEDYHSGKDGIKSFKKEWREGGLSGDQYRNEERGVIILQEYMKTNPVIKLNSELVGIERSFVVDLGEVDGLPVNYNGRIDIEWEWLGYGLLIVDFKTYIGSWKPPSPGLNNQLTGYIYARTEEGEKVYGAAVHSLKVPKTKSISESYCENTVSITTRSKLDLEEWRDDRLQEIRMILSCEKEGVFPMNTGNCQQFGGCVYRQLCDQKCLMGDAYVDDERFIEDVWSPVRE